MAAVAVAGLWRPYWWALCVGRGRASGSTLRVATDFLTLMFIATVRRPTGMINRKLIKLTRKRHDVRGRGDAKARS